jgi:hypothetical protein
MTEQERMVVRRKVNQRHLSALLDMGIPQEQAELALAETGNVGVEVRGPIRPLGFCLSAGGGERGRGRPTVITPKSQSIARV